MTIYRERLWASAGLYIATALVLPASYLVFLPINWIVGIGVGLVLYGGCVAILILAAPKIIVTEHALAAGGAHIPRTLVGEIHAYLEPESTLERGQRLDARAWLLIRGWIGPVVKIEILDPKDPTPYWLVSTRRPEELKTALSVSSES